MKKLLIILLLSGPCFRASAQVAELAQLALNIEKLAQFKQILSDLKKAYQILYGGYNTIKKISEGNFNLHQEFLDGLLQVSPAVKGYKKIADIVSLQVRLVREYRAAHTLFKNNNQFTPTEIDYIGKVYNRLFSQSLNNLDALMNVITANKLRMSDDERLNAIDKIYSDMQEKIVFLRHFNSSTAVLGIQRYREQSDVDLMRKLYDINK
ncbi:MAG: TerB family tellurite resistance protein [Ferruginibacter sp.]|nr:TerB family tellurite resistance protein [Ferruginibacter sp.]